MLNEYGKFQPIKRRFYKLSNTKSFFWDTLSNAYETHENAYITTASTRRGSMRISFMVILLVRAGYAKR
jgi:hypothetical protein